MTKQRRPKQATRARVLLLAVALGLAVVSAVALPALASASSRATAAPLDPAFVRYEDAVQAGRQVVQTAQGGHELGLVPAPVLLPTSPAEASAADIVSLPATFDLRSSGKVSPVKNQNPYGTCWTFATLGSLESSFLPGTLYDFSEDNIARTAGFDLDPYNGGGNYWMSTADLAKSGPVYEADDPYGDSTTPPGLVPRAHLQDALIVVNDTASGKSQAADIAAIKDWLTTGNALYTTMQWSSAAYSSTYKSYYGGASSYSGEGCHAVTIVGWDDTVSASNFPNSPAGDGAWIIKNSWGTSWGQSGYFYLSYYDYWAERFAAAYIGTSASAYGTVYQYDPLGWVDDWSYSWGANDFTATSSDPITTVGFYTPVANSQYEVYTASVHNGVRTSQGSGTLAQAGYHTVALTTPLAVTNGQQFSVILHLTTPGYTWPMATEEAETGYSSAATSASGQSFMSSNGTSWTDVGAPSNSTPVNVCIKAFSAYPSGDTTPPTTSVSGVPAGWSKTAVPLTLTADDGAGVGVQSTFARVDGAAYQVRTSLTVSGDGKHAVDYYSVDKAGNAETPKSATVKIDGTPPGTTATNLQASASTAWQSASSVDVTLTPSDATSGVAQLDWTVDASHSSSSASAPAKVTVFGDGTHTVTYHATDNAGNAESTRTGYVNLDTSAPSASAQVAAPAPVNAAGWYTSGPVTLNVTGADALSGVAVRQYRVQGAGSWNTCTGPVAFPQGTTTYEYRVLDAAGNSSSIGSATASVDTEAPVTSLGSGAAAVWTNAAPLIKLQAFDGGSGVALTQYRRQGDTSWTTYVLPFQITAQGETAWEYRSVDVVGNAETPHSLDVRYDSQAPATVVFAASGKTRKTVALRYRINDASPGCGSGTAIIRIYQGRKLRKTLKRVTCPTNVKMTRRWRCSLPAGRYTVKVSARDAAGNVQSRVGRARLTVR